MDGIEELCSTCDRLVRFGEDDRAALATWGPELAHGQQAFEATLLAWLRTLPEMVDFWASLNETRREWFVTLRERRFGELVTVLPSHAQAARIAKLGEIYYRLGVPRVWILGLYALFADTLHANAGQLVPPAQRSALHSALDKRLRLDEAWMVGGYEAASGAALQRLDHLSRHDPLTGLLNRRGLDERLNEALARARRDGRSVAVGIVDFDGFKALNDRHGHAAGDELLVSFAERLRGLARTSDAFARVGGDEFAFVLESSDAEHDWRNPLERMLGAVEAPYLLHGAIPWRCSASAGITLFPSDDSDAQKLLRHADQALYEAKLARDGAARWRAYDPDVARARRDRLRRNAALANAH